MREEKKIINILSSSEVACSRVTAAKELDVSRQVIVQDIALLRYDRPPVLNKQKYLIQADKQYSRVLKVVHEDDEVEEELSTIVDAGGHVKTPSLLIPQILQVIHIIWTSSQTMISEKLPGGNPHRKVQPS